MSDEQQDKAGTRRCSTCGLSLPNDPAWKDCPQCGELTGIIRNAEPNVTEQEATSLQRAREFQEYLEKEGIE